MSIIVFDKYLIFSLFSFSCFCSIQALTLNKNEIAFSEKNKLNNFHKKIASTFHKEL